MRTNAKQNAKKKTIKRRSYVDYRILVRIYVGPGRNYIPCTRGTFSEGRTDFVPILHERNRNVKSWIQMYSLKRGIDYSLELGTIPYVVCGIDQIRILNIYEKVPLAKHFCENYIFSNLGRAGRTVPNNKP